MLLRKTNKITFFVCIVFMATMVIAAVNSYRVFLTAKQNLQVSENHSVELKKRIVQLSQSIEDYKKEKEEFRQLLFAERDVPAFIDGISEFAKNSSVNIIDMKTQKFKRIVRPEKKDRYKKRVSKRKLGSKKSGKNADKDYESRTTLSAMPIKIRLEGEFESIANFLNKLDNYEQLTTINDVEIKTSRDYPTLVCTFTLRIYSFKELGELEG